LARPEFRVRAPSELSANTGFSEQFMVAIVSGNGLGLFNSSLYTLGAQGVIGSGSVGVSGETASVNIATGNLVLQHTDDFLASLGANVGVLRTYNSQATLSTGNWVIGPQRSVQDAGAASRNQAGARATRTDEDGSTEVFTFDATVGLYRSSDGSGAYDTLSYDAASQRWTFTDGATGATETYDGAASGNLLSATDANGNRTDYTYSDGRLTQICDASGETTSFVYTGADLTEVRVERPDLAGGTVTRVRYEYDALHRLTKVTTDLTPQDGAVADGQSYWVSYGYDGTSSRINLVQDEDGTRLDITYVQIGSDWRTKTLTDANGNQTRFDYDTVAQTTTVTDPLGLATVYAYDSQGQLTAVTPPPVDGQSTSTSFGYDDKGNVVWVQDALNRRVSMSYDANGNLVEQRDAAGNTVRRTYDANNDLLTQTTYTVPDPDGAGAGQPSGALTSRYVYDANRNLRFEISAQGDVTEFRYDSLGQRVSAISYTAQSYALSGLSDTDVPTLAQMQTWTGAIADKSQTQRIDYQYDTRGQLSLVTRYGTVDAAGQGELDGTQTVTSYSYDSFGYLRATQTGARIQTYAYDGLGRLVLTTDAGINTSVVNYDDANRTVTTALPNGLSRTAVYDRTGALLSVTDTSAAAGLGQTTYLYDADGRLRMSQTPTGRRTYYLYDAQSREVGQIDADGSLTENVFDANGELIKQIRYATRIDVSQLLDASGVPTNVSLATLRPLSSADDRTSWNVYDAAGRLVRSIDASGDVTENVYDGTSRLVSVIRYANALDVSQLAAGATLDNTKPAADAGDRTTRFFFDADGRVLATLDADGYLTENSYDAAGRLVLTRRYSTVTTAALRATGSLDQLRPANVDATDIVTRDAYDGEGRLTATIDAEGYLTRLSYDASGNVSTRQRYATRVTSFADTPVANSEDQLTTYQYTARNQLELETSYDGTETRYQYDDAGNLVSTDRAYGTSDVRRVLDRYDAQGRLVAELGPEHAGLLTQASTPAEVDAIFAQYAVTYGYDADGRRVWVSDAKQQKTYYYYDADGQLAYTVNAAGEVERRTYNAFNELETTTRYAARLGGATLGALTGGTPDAALQARLDSLADASNDTVTTYFYTKTGLVKTQQDALQYQTRFEYDAFGELITERQQVDAAATIWQESRYTYDHRGDVLSAVTDPNGLAITTTKTYDAFGRMVSLVDANQQSHTVQYDRLGRVVQTQDPLTPARITTYDAFDRVLTQKDPSGVLTTYTYDREARSVTICAASGTADAVTTKIVYNRFGQQYQVTDARGNTTTYEYDDAGRITRVSDGLGTLETDGYDALTGNLVEHTDAAGVVTRYVYDSVNRLFTRTVDPDGVAATTVYQYDAKGELLDVTDPNGVVTRTEYDVRGQVKSVTVDPDGLALTTRYTYDGVGNTLSVQDPNLNVVVYAYDAAGRRTSETVDPNGLALRTDYGYDAEGNVAWRKDARGNYTRFVYDAKGRLAYTIDPTGAITALQYDSDDRVTSSTSYANTANLAALGVPPTLASVAGEIQRIQDASRDRVELSYYDAQGRLRFTLDGAGVVTEQRFDANGNVLERISYATKLVGAPPASTAEMQKAVYGTAGATASIADAAHDRVTINYFDARNRVTTTVDGTGAVKLFAYDGAGNVVWTYAYANQIANLATLTDEASVRQRLSADASRDQQTRLVYDTAGRLVLSASAQVCDASGTLQWSVEARSLDSGGRITAVKRFANFLSGAALASNPTQLQVAAWMVSVAPSAATDAVTHAAYDAANRLVFSVDAVGGVTRNDYDKAGNLIRQTRYSNPVTLGDTETLESIGTAIRPDAANDRVSYAVFDAANRQVVSINATGAVTEYTLDALGNQIGTTAYATLKGTANWTLDQGYTALLASGFSTWKSAHADALQDRTERAVFDADNRRTHVIDGLGYVTRTDYDGLGQIVGTAAFRLSVAKGIALNAATINAAVGVAADGTLPTDARVEHFTYDARGLLVASQDAMGASESYTYDGVGNKLTYQNKNGAVWTYDYDAHGNLISEKSPNVAIDAVKPTDSGSLGVTETNAPIETRMTYDALGNLTARIEAYGTDQARTTQYGYDAAGHQVRVTYPSVDVYDAASNTLTKQASIYTATTYDALGRAVANRDVGGNYSYRIYDQAGQLCYEVDASGGVTGYGLNAFGQNARITRFDTQLADPATRGGQPYTKSDLDARYVTAQGALAAGRTITMVYDQAGRQTKTIEPQALIYDPTRVAGSSGTVTAGKTTEVSYNAFGQAIRTSVYGQDANGVVVSSASSTYTYYDLRGLQTATLTQVSAGQAYLTANQYDQVGNLTQVTEYASAVSGSDATWLSATPPAAPTHTSLEDDRITIYGYDLDNRKVSETRRQVLYAKNATTANARSDLITTYGYDAVGNQTRVTDALGASTYTYYDALGRTIAIASPEVPGPDGVLVRPYTQFKRDIYGNVVQQTAFANGATGSTASGFTAPGASAADRTTTMQYDLAGNLIRMTDPSQRDTYRAYDASGRVTEQWRNFTDVDGTALVSYQRYVYDALGRQTEVLTPATTAVLNEQPAAYHALIGDSAVATPTLKSGVVFSYGGSPGDTSNVSWSGTNTVQLSFPPIAAGTTVQIVLKYHTGVYGTPGSDPYAPGTDTTQTFTVVTTDGKSVLLSWLDNAIPFGGISAVTGFTLNVRDASGNWVQKATASQSDLSDDKAQIVSVTQATAGSTTSAVTYNVYGEVTEKTVNGQVVEEDDYNAAGQIWRTTGSDGVMRGLLHDISGNVTAEIRSATNLVRTAMDENGVAALRASQTTTETRYDLMGRAIAQIFPTRAAAASATGPATVTGLTWSIKTGADATPPANYDTSYGQYPIVYTSYGGTTGIANRVDFQWTSLANLGNGDVSVHIEYQDSLGHSLVEEREFRAEDAATGAGLYWTSANAAQTITHVVVSKKDEAGNWVTVIDRNSQGNYGSRIVFQATPAFNDVDASTPQVTVLYRLQGTAGWSTATVAKGNLKDFGNSYLFAPTEALSGTYEYQVWYAASGQSAATAHDTGTMTIASSALAVGGAAGFSQSGSSVLSWADPGSGQTEVFRYRVQGTSNWKQLAVANLGGGRLGVDVGGLPDGAYEYELLYYSSGNPNPTAHATGAFTARAAKAASQQQVVVNPASGALAAASATQAREIAWAQPSGTTVTPHFHYRPTGTTNWIELPVLVQGSQYAVDTTALAAGNYDYEIYYRDASDSTELARAGGTMTMGASGTSSISPIQGYVGSSTSPALYVSNTSVGEGDGYAVFTVGASAAVSSATTVTLALQAGTATSADYGSALEISYDNGNTWTSGTSGTLTATRSNFLVRTQLVDDTQLESNESFSLEATAYGGTTNTSAVGEAVIIDNDLLPALTVSNASVAEGGVLFFDLNLSRASTAATAVNLTLNSGTAVLGADFASQIDISTDGGNTWIQDVTAATFAAGATAIKARVQTLADGVPEGNESFSLTATASAGTSNTSATGTGTILDASPPTVSVSGVSVSESAGTASFVVTLSNPTTTTVTVNFATADGTAVAGADYTATSGTLSFAPGETTKTVTVAIIDDNLYEGATPETFQLNLSGPSNATLGTSSATGSISDNEPYGGPTLSVSNATVSEGSYAMFDVTLSNPSAFATTVDLSLYGGTATSGSDFSNTIQVSTDGGATWSSDVTSATFAAGTTALKARVQTLADSVSEGNETFTLTATPHSGTNNTSAAGTGTIIDATLPTVSVGNVSVSEGAGTATFVVTLSNPSTSTVTVNFATANGTAVSGADYTATSGTLSFAPGETSKTVTVAIIDDNLYEGATPETFQLVLMSPANATLGSSSATGSISDNEPYGGPTLSVGNATASEGSYAMFDVTLSNPSAFATTVDLSLYGGTATSGSDFSNAIQVSADGGATWSGNVTSATFAAGTTALKARVQTLADSISEGNETFTLSATPHSGTSNTSATGTGTIIDASLPSISVGNVSVNEGAGTASFVVTLSNPSTSTVTVNFSTANGTAIAGADYTATSGTLSFAPGETSKVVSVAILDDSLYEGATPETFLLNLSSPANATVGTPSATGSIVDNEAAPTLAVGNAAAAEGSYTTFDVTLSTPSAFATTVDLALYGGTATLGSDFSNAIQVSADGGATWSGNVTSATFAAGTTALKARVQTLADSISEGNETFTLSATPHSGTSNTSATGTGTIIDASLPSISVGNVSVNEGAGTASFVVTLSNPSTSTVTVNFSTANGTAIAGSDYTATSGTLSFAPGETSKTVTVAIINDTLYEGATPETFQLNLSSPANATLGSSAATGSIVDNDAAPTLVVSNATAAEGSYTTFDVTLSNASAFATTVDLALYGGTATLGSDFSNAIQVSADGGATWSGNVTSATFAAGATALKARVQTLNDSISEGNESFTLTATPHSGTSNTSATGTGTIIDASLPSISVGGVSVNESAGTAMFTVALSNPSTSAVTVNFSTANGTAIAGSDYTATSGTLSFAPGETSKVISVAIVDDSLYEGATPETFQLNLSSPANATLGTSAATGSIVDNDAAPTLAVSNGAAAEGSYAMFDVTLSNASAFATTVDLALYGGTATLGSDFSNAIQVSSDGGATWSGNVTSATFAAGTTAMKARVQTLTDNVSEGNESFTLTATPHSGTSNASATGTGTIVDSSLPTINVSGVSVNENAGTANFVVTLSNPSTSTVTVNFGTVNGTAIAGSDYTATSGTLSFAPGETSKVISVAIINDTIYEGATPETFQLNLGSPGNATLGTTAATGSIIDDDSVPRIVINDVSVGEAAGTATFTVSLSNASASAISVNYATANGTATAGSDYTAKSGTLTFAAGVTTQTVSVSIIDDTKYEGSTPETYYVNLSSAVGATISDSQGIGYIVDNDPYGSLSAQTMSLMSLSTGSSSGSASLLSVQTTQTEVTQTQSAYGGSAVDSLVAIPTIEPLLQSVVSWAAPAGADAASSIFRYREQGSYDWITVPITLANGQMSATVASPGMGVIEYDVSFRAAGSTDEFSYAAGEVVVGDALTPRLSQDTGPRAATQSVAAQSAFYSATTTTLAGQVAISLPDAGLASASLTSSGADRNVTPEMDFTLDRWGNRIAVTDVRNANWVTEYAYDQNNNVIETMHTTYGGAVLDASQAYYDALGREVGTSDALGHSNSRTLDAAGNVIAEQHADGGVVSNAHDIFGELVGQIDAEGRMTTYTYDKLGEMLTRTVGTSANASGVTIGSWFAPQGWGTTTLQTTTGTITTTYTYDALGHRITEDDGAGDITSYRYDAAGNLTATKSPAGDSVQYAYNAAGLKIAEVDANGYYQTWNFDATGRLVSSRELGGATLTYSYDTLGDLTQATRTVGLKTYQTWYRYDNAGQVVRIADQASDTLTEYSYDASGRHITERTTVGGQVQGLDDYYGGRVVQDNYIGYDELGQMRYVADGVHYMTIDYDLVGNRTHVATRYINDSGTQRNYDYWYAYDAMNRQTVVDGVRNAATGVIDVAIDQGHRLTYDKTGNRTSDVTYGREAYLAPSTTTLYGGGTSTDMVWKTEEGFTTEVYAYDAAGRLATTTRDGIVVDQRVYDAAGRVVESGAETTAAQRALWNDADNKWEENSQVTQTRYDADGRVVAEKLYGLDRTTLQQTLENYKYDAAGNLMGYQLVSHQGSGFTNTYTNTYQRFASYKQASQAGTSTAFDSGETDYTFDAEGNLIGVTDQKAAINDRQFANDLAGRVLEKISFSNDNGVRVTHRERGMIVNGEYLGESGDDATEATRTGVDGTRTDGAFDLAWKQIDASYPGAGPGAYTVAAGDTLQSIAKSAYGDASQWYRIAEANGLNFNSTLNVGQVLKLPAAVGASNNADTYNPYDPMSRIGDTNPTMPTPDTSSGCGTAGMILIIVVVIVASILTAGAAATAMGATEGIWTAGTTALTSGSIAGSGAGLSAAGVAAAAVGGAVGSAVGQGIAMATGMQDEFSWRDVGLGALTAAVAAGAGSALGAGAQGGGLISTPEGATSADKFVINMANAAIRSTASSAITQGLEGTWSWRNIAASAAGAAAGYAAGQAGGAAADSLFGETKLAGGVATQVAPAFVRGLMAGTAAGIAQNVTMLGFHGGKLNYGSIAADAFANAFGEAIAGEATVSEQQSKLASLQGDLDSVDDTHPKSFAASVAQRQAVLQSWGMDSGGSAGTQAVQEAAEVNIAARDSAQTTQPAWQAQLDNLDMSQLPRLADASYGVGMSDGPRLSDLTAGGAGVTRVNFSGSEWQSVGVRDDGTQIGRHVTEDAYMVDKPANSDWPEIPGYAPTGETTQYTMGGQDWSSSVYQPTSPSGPELAARFGEGVLGAVKGVTVEPLLQLHDLALAVPSVLYNEVFRSEGDPLWLPEMKSGMAESYASGASQTRLMLQSTPWTSVGVASYDLTTAAKKGDWGTVAEMGGGLVGGFAIGKGVSKFGGYSAGIEDIQARGPGASQRGAINFKLYDTETQNRILASFRAGNEFETQAREAAGEEKNYTRIYGAGELDGNYAIPDVQSSGRIVEIKDVRELSRDQQFRIYEQSAKPIDLIVSPKTEVISTPLIDTVRNSGGSISIFDPKAKVFHPYDFSTGTYLINSGT